MSLAVAGKFGLGFTPNDRNVYNRTGGTVAIGDVLVCDVSNASGDATNTVYGDEASAYSNMVIHANSNAEQRGSLVGVVVGLRGGAGADNTKITCRFTGKVTANVTEDSGTGGSMTQGQVLYLNGADAELHSNTSSIAAARKIIGYYDDGTALTQGTTGLREITMNGINGFGGT